MNSQKDSESALLRDQNLGLLSIDDFKLFYDLCVLNLTQLAHFYVANPPSGTWAPAEPLALLPNCAVLIDHKSSTSAKYSVRKIMRDTDLQCYGSATSN